MLGSWGKAFSSIPQNHKPPIVSFLIQQIYTQITLNIWESRISLTEVTPMHCFVNDNFYGLKRLSKYKFVNTAKPYFRLTYGFRNSKTKIHNIKKLPTIL